MSSALASEAGCPVSVADPFTPETLTDPYPMHDALRALGPVVFLQRYGIFAMTGYDEVRTVLSDWQTYCSSAGVGLSDFRKEKPWRTPSLVLEADPPLHTRTRTVLTRILSPAAIRSLKETFEAEAERLVARLVDQRCFNAVKDLAEVFPLKVFPDAVGLPEEGRENLLPYGALAFNAFGPRNWLLDEAMARSEPVIAWITSKCSRSALAPDGLGMQIFEAADRRELTEEEASLLVRSFLTAGLDTTVNGLGNALFCFSQNPQAWEALRAEAALVRSAFDEVLRYESPVQTFFRTTTQPVEVAGVPIPDGQKVLVFLAAANRDPRRWENPTRFDVRRRAAGHVGFGKGIHGCVGQAIARLEAEAILSALVQQVAEIRSAGEPVRRLNNTLRGLASLPIEVVPA